MRTVKEVKPILKLPNVTLFGIDAHDPKGLLHAAEVCKKQAIFGKEVIITEHNYFRGREGYSRFCIERMNEFVHTSHVLIIHPDGFIQNPDAWDDDWLQYDYIGAVWDFHNKYMVGNGGFSLRSKKLLEIISNLDLEGINPHPEDDLICRRMRNWLENEHGIKFAPVEVAKQFSIEGYGLKREFCRWNGEFGFHGRYVTGLKNGMAAGRR